MPHSASAPSAACLPAVPVDSLKALRRSLGQFATGVAVITLRTAEGAVDGMTINSFSSLSLDPPLILWSIRRNASTLQQYLEAPTFAVNVLAEQQMDVSRHFATPAAMRTGIVLCHPGVHTPHLPLIEGAIAHFECAQHAVVEGGDHFILIGRVLHHASHPGEPLLFYQGEYACARVHPQAAASANMETATHFLRLLSQASTQTTRRFQRDANLQGWNTQAARVMGQLHRHPCSLPELEVSTLLGKVTVEAALEALQSKGYVSTQPSGDWQLTASGQAACVQWLEAMRHYSEHALASIEPSDLQATSRVLTQLGATA